MGLFKNRTFYTYKDVTIIPGEISDIKHRSECIPLDENGMLPLFTAPMDTVVDEKNFEEFTNEMIYAILPRTVNLSTRIEYSTRNRWAAYSLNEFETVFCGSSKLDETYGIKALIDVANGHMKVILDLVRAAKNIYGDNITIMVGNIANPQIYSKLARAGADFVRIGIGSGNGCLSTSNTGIHMPMASLIDEVVHVKNEMSSYCNKLPYIVADGGIRNYSDIIKALALGADYVMCGSIFAQMVESAAKKVYSNMDTIGIDIGLFTHFFIDDNKCWHGTFNGNSVPLGDIYATFYGMASKEGQIALNGEKTKTSEGIKKLLKVEYKMHGWVSNFMDYLRSAMSYVGTKTLDDFKKDSVVIINSPNAVLAVNK